MSASTLRRNSYLATPLYLLSLAPFVALAFYLDLHIHVGYVLLGALGWWIALLLRLPFILLIQKRVKRQDIASRYVVGLSGPAEEAVRLALLLFIGLSFDNAYSIGLGWAAIEIVYGLIQLFGIATLNEKTDAKSLEAKEMIEKLGMDKTFEESTPFWGSLERVSASAIHISFGLMITFNPFLVLVTAPLHSLVNFFVVGMNKKSVMASQLLFLFFSLTLFIILLLFQ